MAAHEVQALWALAAGELDAEARARVEAHVAGCAECARELERVRQSRAVLHEARTVTPEVRWDAVDAPLRAEAARRMAARAPRSRLPWAVALAGACAAMLAFWMLRTPVAGPAGAVPRVETPRVGDGAQASAQRETPGGAVATDSVDTVHTESTSGAVVRESGGAERALQSGTQLRSGTAVLTPARSTVSLRLPDASRVRLSAGSEVELSRAEAKAIHLTVKQGRLSVQASHAEREKFLVEAAGLRVSVVGTVFTVERTEHGAAVAVAEGRVRVEAEGQPERLVSAGERVELDADAKTLKQTPVLASDHRAFEELKAPTVAAEAVAQAAQAPAPEKPVVATREAKPRAVPVTPHTTGGLVPALKEQVAEAPAQPQPATEAAPAAVALVPPPGTEPDQEFAPYPAKSVTEQLPPKPTQAPEPPQAMAEAPPAPAKDPKKGLTPMALLSKDADERYLGYARLQMSSRTCESYLAGLAEIAQRSPRKDHREQARYLRARCFEEKLQPQAAQGEYRQYLNEFPRGRYVREAKTALLP